MDAEQAVRPVLLWRLKPWQLIVVFNILLFATYGIGSFTFDFFAGAATAGFGVWGEVGGVGMFFTYVMAYFIVLIVILPILVIRRFWVGMSIYALYALSGLFFEYYFDLVVEQNLIAYWGVIGWCVLGLANGLSADLAYRYLPANLSGRWRAVFTGVILGGAIFATVAIALEFFYVERELTYTANYLSIAYYGVPFMLVSSGFGGYTAYAISKKV